MRSTYTVSSGLDPIWQRFWAVWTAKLVEASQVDQRKHHLHIALFPSAELQLFADKQQSMGTRQPLTAAMAGAATALGSGPDRL